jgi:hypothetical protein
VESPSGRVLQARPGGHAKEQWGSGVKAGSLPQLHSKPLMVGVHVPLCLHRLGRQLAETSIDSGHFEASEGCQP